MNPRWHPDNQHTWDAFFINRRERALARYEEDGLPPGNFHEAGRRLWWYGRTLQSVMDYITAGDIPRLRYPQFEPRAPDDSDDSSSDDDAGNLEGDDYQYNGGGYEDYDFAATPCISNGPTKIINGIITCLFFTFPFTFPFTFSILHESITEMSKIAFIDEIIPFFIFFHYNPSFSMLGPTIIAWHETCEAAYEDIFKLFHSRRLDYNLVRLFALNLAMKIKRESTPDVAIADPYYMRESQLALSAVRVRASLYLQKCFLDNKRKDNILLAYFPEDTYCVLISIAPKYSLATYFDSGSAKKKNYARIRGVLDDALEGYFKKGGAFKEKAECFRDDEMPTYVVYKGRVPGVYEEWQNCLEQVHNFSGNSYKGYATREEAVAQWRAHVGKKKNRLKFLVPLLLTATTCISENFVYATELVQTCYRRRAPCIILKLDFAKAFDSVSWASLRSVMLARGFPELWCDWMDMLFTSSRSAVLLNGVPGKWIRCLRGLRQGDPLSPYLFLITADVLQRLVRRDDLLQHPLVNGAPCPVLQYTDDTLIILCADVGAARRLRLLL
ncbi:hypothetical protein QYE76_037940 [Lolium multiflorum]|uniref:Reverse transcriptase domain-containing protein n=1 Tax=Lolium multiflorum TaxID=4521 RepID=A0AAD8T843_LOLMU|nr:hypothetical protein QYE76_037940 [Lolium multiflorum]